MHEFLELVVEYVVPWIEAIGVAIVLWGVVEALVRLLRRTWAITFTGDRILNFRDIRLRIGEKLVLGLEFFLAADIIRTIVVPSWESLGILAGIVAIRSLIVYFLHLEMRADRQLRRP